MISLLIFCIVKGSLFLFWGYNCRENQKQISLASGKNFTQAFSKLQPLFNPSLSHSVTKDSVLPFWSHSALIQGLAPQNEFPSYSWKLISSDLQVLLMPGYH